MEHRSRFTLAALAVLGLCASPHVAHAQTVALNDPWQRSASSPDGALSRFFPLGQGFVSLTGFTAPPVLSADGPDYSPYVGEYQSFYMYTLVSPLTPLQRQKLAATIHIGMSRAQVDRLLLPDGGATSSSLGRYYVGNGFLVDVPYDDHGGPFLPQNRVTGPVRFYPGSFHTD